MKPDLKKFRLSHLTYQRRDFNPASADDLGEYKYFLQHQRWRKGCPFVLEWPFLDIMQMIEHKIVREHLNKLIKLSK